VGRRKILKENNMEMSGSVVSLNEKKMPDGLVTFEGIMKRTFVPGNNLEVSRMRGMSEGDEIYFGDVQPLTEEEEAELKENN
jgi:hypothetical protein